MAEGNTETAADEWRFAPVWRRIVRPIGQLSFYAVLGIGILLVGFLAVWIEEANVARALAAAPRSVPDIQPLRLSYATAILALAAPCLMQLILGESKVLRVFAIMIGSAVLGLTYSVAAEADKLADLKFYGRWGLVLAVLSWWLANGEDDLFQDKSPANTPSGGSTSRKLSGGKSKVKT